MVESSAYQAEDVQKIVSELFSGKLTVAEALKQLRSRLLDLSSRNRLLNFKYPKRRSLQFVNVPNWNIVYDRLLDNKYILIKPVPEPNPSKNNEKKPEARQYASELGISISYDLSISDNGQRVTSLQTLFYPSELERQLRKINAEAKSAIEETGTNILYVIFGFLEFYESDSSEIPLNAPLICMPVSLSRGPIDSATRFYQYNLEYNGEDINENYTLREKLKHEFGFNFPIFEEDDDPESYLLKIEGSIRSRSRWKVKRQITLAMLSFGKLAIWADLDPNRSPGLLSHPILKSIFEGGQVSDGGKDYFSEEYNIDDHKDADLQLIYDADSSQHSALIDVLSGKNLVINGPPGTGKSQTITNIIAAAISNKKKVLFVSEKLAALEVVRRRLDQANLGHFCLELHSNKTQKKKLLEDIEKRLDQSFNYRRGLEEKLSSLVQKKKILKRYAEIIGLQSGNELGLSIHDVFWNAEKYRQSLNGLETYLNKIIFPNAKEFTHDDLAEKEALSTSISELFKEIVSYDHNHPWWGFSPNLLAPGHDTEINEILNECISLCSEIQHIEEKYKVIFETNSLLSAGDYQDIKKNLSGIPDPPDNLFSDILVNLFPISDLSGRTSGSLLKQMEFQLKFINDSFLAGSYHLSKTQDVDEITFKKIEYICDNLKCRPIYENKLSDLKEFCSAFLNSISMLSSIINKAKPLYIDFDKNIVEQTKCAIAKASNYKIDNLRIEKILSYSDKLHNVSCNLDSSFQSILDITERNMIDFDGSFQSVNLLESSEFIKELKNKSIDDRTLLDAKAYSNSNLSELPLSEVVAKRNALNKLVESTRISFSIINDVSTQIGTEFDGSFDKIRKLKALTALSEKAPLDLLNYRQESFCEHSMTAIINKAEELRDKVLASQKRSEQQFYLDNLPELNKLKEAIGIFRRGDSSFNFLKNEWRQAKKIFRQIARRKDRVPAGQCVSELNKLVEHLEIQSAYLNINEYDCFGSLFKGLNTDYDAMRRLHSWYLLSQEELIKAQFSSSDVNVTNIPTLTITILSTRANEIKEAISQIESINHSAKSILEPTIYINQIDCLDSIQRFLEASKSIIDEFDSAINFFSPLIDLSISIKRAIQLIDAHLEIKAASASFVNLKETLKNFSIEAPEFELNKSKFSNWFDFIEYLIDACSSLKTISNIANHFSHLNNTLYDSLSLFQTKLMLDNHIRAVAKPDWEDMRNWEDYLKYSQQIVSDLVETLDYFSLYAENHITYKNAHESVSKICEGKRILQELSCNKDIESVFGSYYLGLNTDLETLKYTHAWGSSLVKSKLPSEIIKNIINSDAKHKYFILETLSNEASNFYESLKEKFESLNNFGSFDSNVWHGTDDENELSIQLIKSNIEKALENIDLLIPWSKYLNIRAIASSNHDLGEIIALLESNKISSEHLCVALKYVIFRSIGISIYKEYPELSKFSGSIHESIRSEYSKLDREIINLNGTRLAYWIDSNKTVPQGNTGIHVRDLTDMYLIRKELSKTKRHIPIRQLIKRAGKALLELKPCFMMGPLSVAQYLEQGNFNFDIVIMDEASQLRPEDALGAISRGSQLVVVGDPKQLPPTSFFDRLIESADDDEEETALTAISGMESILDICQQLFHPIRSLRWHYRSQHHSLISFSNHNFYRGNLIVFPSPFERNPQLGIRYNYLKNGVYQDRKNLTEAQRVVDAIIERMIKYPDESFGVVTLNLTQKDLIEDLLEDKLRNIKEGSMYIDKWQFEGWPFFIKNLENVQGDERDVIFISTTFGKSLGSSKVRQNFGPISRPGGWRRLNVLFTRARKKIELFSSMLPEDIIIDDKTPQGTVALRDYLEYAKKGVLVNTDYGLREPDSEFEVSVANILQKEGFDIIPQLGVAGYFIDIAVKNPDSPGELLAGIECDGATYHRKLSVRDRDRLRQEILESLGWKNMLWRIWSTDWFSNPRREIERLLQFLEKRRAQCRSKMIDMEEEYFKIDDIAIDNTPYIPTNDDDPFIEIGDQIVFCYLDKPDEKKQIRITESESDSNRGLINEHTPLAKALLGLRKGEEGEITFPKHDKRYCKVLSIQRALNNLDS